MNAAGRGPSESVNYDLLEKAVLGFFDPHGVSLYIDKPLPDEVRNGTLGIGDLLLKDSNWGMTYVHEFVHHLQTTGTLSGIRLFHYWWTNRINLLSSLDHEVLQSIAQGQTLYTAIKEHRRRKAYANSAVEKYDYDFHRYRCLSGLGCDRSKHLHNVPQNEVRVRTTLEPLQHSSLPELSIPLLKVRIDYPDGNSEETILGAHQIKEGAARAVELLFLDSFFPAEKASVRRRLERESVSSNPEITPYYTAFNVFLSHVTENRFRDLRVFAIVCELALMYDVVLSEYNERLDGSGKSRSFSSKQEMIDFWRRDVGPGIAFFHLLQVLKEKHEEIPSLTSESDGQEIYCALAKLAHIPISPDSLANALHFVESSNFLFGEPDWEIMFRYARERIRKGLTARIRWPGKPLLPFILDKDMKCLLDMVSTPTLVCYQNTITAPTCDIEQLTPLLFKELVDSLLHRGHAECMLRAKYPQFCDRSPVCSQGAYRRLPPDMAKPEFWCPYIKGVYLVQKWLSLDGDMWGRSPSKRAGGSTKERRTGSGPIHC